MWKMRVRSTLLAQVGIAFGPKSKGSSSSLPQTAFSAVYLKSTLFIHLPKVFGSIGTAATHISLEKEGFLVGPFIITPCGTFFWSNPQVHLGQLFCVEKHLQMLYIVGFSHKNRKYFVKRGPRSLCWTLHARFCSRLPTAPFDQIENLFWFIWNKCAPEMG